MDLSGCQKVDFNRSVLDFELNWLGMSFTLSSRFPKYGHKVGVLHV